MVCPLAGPSALQQLHSLSAALSHLRNVQGLAMPALELLQVARLTCNLPQLQSQRQQYLEGAGSLEDNAKEEFQGAVWEGWGTQLAAAAVKQAMMGVSGDDAAVWKAEAARRLQELKDTGIDVDVDR